MSEYLVVIEHDGECWGAYCPDLPGLGVVGETSDEVDQLIREAIASISRACTMPAIRSRRRRGSTTLVEFPAA